MLQQQLDRMESNLGNNLQAKERYVHQLIDDGFELIVPPEVKWDPKQRKQEDFVNKLNTSSYHLLAQSFEKMLDKEAILAAKLQKEQEARE